MIYSILAGASLVLIQLFALNVTSDDKPLSVAIQMVYCIEDTEFLQLNFQCELFYVGYFTVFPLFNYVYQLKVLKFFFFSSFSSFFIRISVVMYLRHHWLQQRLMVVEMALCSYSSGTYLYTSRSHL